MSGRRVQHLVERGRGYQLRIPVPVDLQELLGRKELRWSVQTRDPSVAKDRVLEATLAFRRFCDKLRSMKSLSVADAREIARAFYQNLTDSYRSPAPIPDDAPPYVLDQQEEMAEEEIVRLQQQVDTRSFELEVTHLAEVHATDGSYLMPEPGTEAFRALCEGIARARIEHVRFTLFRQRDAICPYEPHDALFRHPQQVSHPQSAGPELQSIAIAPGLTIDEALKKYTAAFSNGPGAWSPKTAEEKKRTFQILRAVWGAELAIGQVSTDHVRNIRDFIQALRSKAELDLDKPEKMLTKLEQERLNPITAAKYFGYVRAFLVWLVAEGYLETEPGATIKLAVPKAVGKKTEVRPFSSSELDTVFSSPLYAGFKSNKQRHMPGKMKRQDGLYWMFLLGLHTGMREGELLQIAKSDVRVDEPVPYIDIRPDLDLKTDTSARQVPIHPDLFDYGLSAWLASRPKPSDQRLFCEIGLGAEGHRTSVASKQLNNYLKRIGVKTGRDLVFHSFRHSFMDGTRNSDVPYERAKQLVGHADSSVSGGYGQGANLKTLYKEMTKIDFGLGEGVKALLRANAKTG